MLLKVPKLSGSRWNWSRWEGILYF